MEVVPTLNLAHLSTEWLHKERLTLCRTYIHTVTATCTVKWRNLNAELVSLSVTKTLLELSTLWSCCYLLLSCEEWTDSCVRTNVCTLITLDTSIYIPTRNVYSNTTLLPSCSTIVPSTILATIKCRYREQVALKSVDWINNVANKLRTSSVNVLCSLSNNDICPLGRNLNLNYCSCTCVNGCVVHIDDILTLLAIRLVDSLLHLLYSLLERNNVCDLEECRLHDGICTATKAKLCCDLCSVDDIEVDVVLCKICLHVVRQSCASGLHITYRVEQE